MGGQCPAHKGNRDHASHSSWEQRQREGQLLNIRLNTRTISHCDTVSEAATNIQHGSQPWWRSSWGISHSFLKLMEFMGHSTSCPHERNWRKLWWMIAAVIKLRKTHARPSQMEFLPGQEGLKSPPPRFSRSWGDWQSLASEGESLFSKVWPLVGRQHSRG